ncbi:MAG: hypothetical protein RBR35_17850 [Salinivirgaceae bacterium]|nr:hypothetical protein [Salinivirgaceae bacterium]
MTMQQLIKQNSIRLVYNRTDQNPHMDDFEGDHYRVTLKRPGRRMTLVFSKGFGHKGAPPAVVEILECLQSDARIAEDCASFEGFCSDLGYNSDSRRAEKTYKALKRQAAKLQKFFGDLYEDFLDCEEED